MAKIKNILLIDDHSTTNYYHEYILKKSNQVDNIVSADNVDDAAVILRHLDNIDNNIEPSIVFLDVNLPKYSGFELINRNIDLIKNLVNKGVKIVMLSSSQNPADLKIVADNPLILGFYEKPLTLEILDEVCTSF